MLSFLAAVNARTRDCMAQSMSEDALLERLESSSAVERSSALDILCEPQQLSAAVLSAVLKSLSHADEEVCFASASVLLAMADAHMLAPHTAELLHHFELAPSSLRWRVAEVVGLLDAATLLPHTAGVVRLLAHADADVRRRAIELLGSSLTEANAEVVDACAKCLTDEDEDCRLSAVELLGRLPAESIDRYVPALLSLVRDDEEGCVRMTAVGVIGQLPTAQLARLAPALIGSLDDAFWRVRRQAMEVLSGLPAAILGDHLDAALERVAHSDPRVREWAVAALSKIMLGRAAAEEAKPTETEMGPLWLADEAGAQAVAALQMVLQDEDRRVRERAAALIKRLSPGTEN